MKIFVIAAFGSIGGLLRLVVEQIVQVSNGFPLSTLVINLSGSLMMGFFIEMAIHKRMKEWVALGVGVGFIGAFTTFSTFSTDVIQLFHTNLWFTAMYVIGSIVGGVLCAYAGEYVASSVFESQIPSETTERREVYP